MKYEGKFHSIDVYSDPECPPGKIYFIEGKLKIPPGTILSQITTQIEELIKEVKKHGG